MEKCYGQNGWKEFNRNRKDILSELDKVLEQTENRPIQVSHGLAVEAHLRKWLSEFLPKKYGVTSGYIIPNLYGDSMKLYHYDIIIYNQLESPILWTEGNFDQSEQGKYRAIPAKHVISVYEVKSRLTKLNVTDALGKLSQTKDFSQQLNPFFTCGIIFIDLKESDNNNESIIKELIKGKDIFGFKGGMILRYEGDHSCTGLIWMLNNSNNPKDKVGDKKYKPIAKIIDDLEIYLTEDGALTIPPGCGAKCYATENGVWSVSKSYGISYSEGTDSIHLDWSRTNFSDFCIDLLSSFEGLLLDDKNRPVFGKVFDNIELKKAPLQNVTPEKGKPFLEIKLYEGGEHGDKSTIDYNSPDLTIKYTISIENKGDVEAILSTDSFQNKFELPAGKTAYRTDKLQMKTDKTYKNLKELLNGKPFELLYRVVYYPVNTNREFCSIETIIGITGE